MKVAVITRHAITNYGSLLQSLATQKILTKLGYDSLIIDYVRKDENYCTIAKVLLEKNPKWNKNFLTRTVYMLLQSPEYYIAGKAFEKMQKRHLSLTGRCETNEDLIKLSAFDIYMTGSDQVWGPIGNESYDGTYFLDFAPDNAYKVSYAGSFGRTVFTDDVIEKYKSLLKRYDKITVRENSALDILSNMGFNDVLKVLDPTLLIDKAEWETYIPENKNYGKYVLIYQLHNNPAMDEYAVKFAQKAGLPLVRVTPSLHHITRSGKAVFLPDMGEFLGYIKNAEYMITDSFHGTAFAINFNTQFVNVLSGKTGDNTASIMNATKTRNQSILELTNLTDRILGDFEDFSFINNRIDFEDVNNLICEHRKQSIDILDKILSGGRKDD